MLQVQGLYAGYGYLEVIRDIALDVNPGEFVGVLGPNGAGKSTLLRAIMGSCQVTKGSITLSGLELVRMPGHQRAASGISYVPEGRRIWPQLTVVDNLLMGGWTIRKSNTPSIREVMDEVLEIFPRLTERLKTRAGMLSGGEQQMLALGRALMSKPQVLLVDEPSTGLSPLAVTSVIGALKDLHTARGLSVLLVEQRVDVAIALCQRGYMVNRGEITFAGEMSELAHRAESGYFSAD